MWNNLSSLIYRKKGSFRGKLEDASLAAVWKETIQQAHPHASPYTEYQYIKNKTLYVKVNDVIWISELETKKHELRSKINRKRTNPIKAIRFVL